MAEKSRGLSFFLFICALLSGVIFYGCGGGGGTSSQSVPLQISGNVTSITPLANLRDEASLRPELRAASSLAGIEVYLENYRELNSTRSDSDGNYLLSGVPAGSHFLVARADTATGTVLKVRSAAAVMVTESRPNVQAPAMALLTATASASGRIVDVNGNPVRNGRLMVWGEPFYTDSNGYYSTPPMPANTVASIVIAVPGYQQTAIEVKFNDNPPFVEQTIVDNAATNRPPTSTLSASRYSVSPGVSVAFAATASDPDETLDSDNYSWTATLGTFSGSLNSLNAAWIAPSENALATIAFVVTDAGGLRSKSNALIVVGTGIYAPNVNPTVTSITANSSSFVSGLSYTLSANATDSNGDALTLTWTASPTAAAGTLSGQSGLTIVWKAPVVNEPTDVEIKVSITDGKGGTASYSRLFNVVRDPAQDTNQAPDEVEILMPTANQLFVPSEKVTFSGRAHDPEDGELAASALTWYLKAPGQSNFMLLGAGSASFSYTLPTNPGNYSVKLLASDKYQASATAILGFRVNWSPVATIGTPANNTTVQIGAVVTFTGSANDVEDGAVNAASLTWLFPAPIGTQVGGSIATSTLPEGVHNIQLSARDSKGAVSATTTIKITVTNTGPTMTIASPTNGSSVLASASTNISGSGIGLDGIAVAASTMEWQLWSTGVATESIASGTASFSKTFANLGEHVLTLTGKDSAGKASSTQTLFYVNASPSVMIDSPATGTRFDLGESITLQATLIDPDPSEAAYMTASWTSKLNGVTTVIGSGNPKSTSTLASGSHLITCTVTDRFGLASSSEIMLLVNSLPVATITYSTTPYAMGPNNRPVFMSEQPSIPVSFDVDSFDAEINGTVESYNNDNVKWFRTYNNIETQIGTGSSIVDSLPVGISTITVKLFDSFFEDFPDQASNSVSLQVQVWQSRSFPYATTTGFLTDAVDISGTPSEMAITFNTTDPAAEPDRGSVRVFKYEEGLGVDYFDMADSGAKFHTATAPVILTTVASAIKISSKMMVLGVAAGPTIKLLRYDAVASYTHNSPALTTPTNISSDGTRMYICDYGANSILLMNPSNFEITNTVTSANDLAFLQPRRVRYSDRTYGQVFVVDQGNNRVVRYGSELLGTALQPILVDDPIDAGFSSSYMLVMDNSSVVSVVEPNTGSILMTFGESGTGAGQFNAPTAIMCSGKDLFVLEATRIQVIRSGVNDWLKN